MEQHPQINWLGGMLITRELLSWSKGNVEDDSDRESFVSKINRPNLIQRVMAITQLLNASGPTLETAQTIQQLGWFTDVSAESLATKLTEAIEKMRSGGVWKFRVAECGTLQFQTDAASQPDETD